jgi:hypothetical protein
MNLALLIALLLLLLPFRRYTMISLDWSEYGSTDATIQQHL